MEITNIHQAKTHLSRLVDRAAAGEEIIIAKSGKPVAKLVSYQASQKPRRPGFWKGKIKIARDFDELPREIAEAFGMKAI
jgi:prevent-host-death family protein